MAERTKRDVIAESLRRRILSGDIERGARLRQDELARWFDASITPVREALRRLEAEGLVTSEAHRGVRVAGVDIDSVTTLYIRRMLAEPYAMRRAALRISRLEIRRARALLDELASAIEAGDGGLRNQLTRDFHFFFYDRCGLPGLTGEIAGLWDAFPWDFTLDSSDRAHSSHDEHLGLIEAVEAGDDGRAAALMEDHIRSGFLRLAAKIVGEEIEDPFALDVG